jgi:hypothetical protein
MKRVSPTELAAPTGSVLSRLWGSIFGAKPASPPPNAWSREFHPSVHQMFTALKKSESDRDIWRVRLQAEDTLLPDEMAYLIGKSSELPKHAQKWLARMDMLGRFSDGEPQHYAVEALSDNVQIFHDASIPRERKRLIVAYCGAGNRLMLATSCVLQHLPSDLCDVVVLRDPSRRSYFKGVPGYADTLPSLVRRLAADVGADAYWRIYSFGTCMGAFPALRGGLLMQADRAVAVSGGFPLHARRLLEEPEFAPPAFDPLCGSVANPATDLICAFAEAHTKDERSAVHLSRVRSVTLLPLPELTEHNIIKEQAKKGILRAFFKDMFELGGTRQAAPRVAVG